VPGVVLVTRSPTDFSGTPPVVFTGPTWTTVLSEGGNQQPSQGIIHPTDPLSFYVQGFITGTSSLKVSHDGGTTWTSNSFPTTLEPGFGPNGQSRFTVDSAGRFFATEWDFNNGGAGVGFADNGVWVTADDGSSWTQILTEPSEPALPVGSTPFNTVGGLVGVWAGPTTLWVVEGWSQTYFDALFNFVNDKTLILHQYALSDFTTPLQTITIPTIHVDTPDFTFDTAVPGQTIMGLDGQDDVVYVAKQYNPQFGSPPYDAQDAIRLWMATAGVATEADLSAVTLGQSIYGLAAITSSTVLAYMSGIGPDFFDQILRSTDTGATFTVVHTTSYAVPLPGGGPVPAITQGPNTGEAWALAQPGNDVLHSTDIGVTWNLVDASPLSDYQTSIASRVFASSASGLQVFHQILGG